MRVYVDFRVMLEKADKDIDAVLVAAPNHVHAVASHGGDSRRQRRLLREAADPFGVRGCERSRKRLARPRSPRNWATRAIRRTTFAARSSGSAMERSARCAKCTPGAAAPTRIAGPSGPQKRPPCRKG